MLRHNISLHGRQLGQGFYQVRTGTPQVGEVRLNFPDIDAEKHTLNDIRLVIWLAVKA